ncbi:acid protease [Lactarius deliciosus]|nr:acid protease [Lactarius deliciosus]
MLALRTSIVLAALLRATQGSLATYTDLTLRSGPLFTRSSTSGLDSINGSYNINITLGGNQYSVIIDTGSSDLWVAGVVPRAKDTGADASIQYAIGSVAGPVKTAQLEILGFTVPDQAFIEVPSGVGVPDGTGLIGLGPNIGSRVHDVLDDLPAGDTPLDRIFRQNLTTPNYLTVLLNRPSDTAEKYAGAMTIGEVLPQYSNITNQPKVPVSSLQGGLFAQDQHWSIVLDSNGIIGPDGKAIKVTSNAPFAPIHDVNQLVAIIDTGFTLPQVPSEVARALYSGAKGAKLLSSSSGDIWVIDCDAEINATFLIGGQSYPIHPLDLNQQGTDDYGNEICFGAYQPRIPGADDPASDMILGMAWLTNVYLLINYGDFVDGTTKTGDPYVQLLSMTDPAAAHADFVATRLGEKNNTSSPLNPGPNGAKGLIEKHGIPVLAGVAVAGAVAVMSV